MNRMLLSALGTVLLTSGLFANGVTTALLQAQTTPDTKTIPVAKPAPYAFPFELESDRKPKIHTNGNVLIRNGRVLTAVNGTLENTDILIEAGKIKQIGKNLAAPAGFQVVDATGKVVAPGIVDAHSHRSSDGTNEGSDSITAEVRIGDVLNLGSLTTWQALASGHTAALILHGSANAVGGQSQVIKYKYGRPNTEGPIPDAPRMIKFALGENVTQKNGTNTTRFPKTRMGVEAVYRRGFNEAKQYLADWDAYNTKKTTVKPRRDLRLETLGDILQRKIWVQCHSYRSDEMLMMVRLSQEFGFKIGAMQHALEAYKIAPELAAAGVGVSIFVDNWSFKQEGYDAIPWNASICQKAGVLVSLNTDGVSGTTALNIDAAKTMKFGGFTEQQALQLITLNPAKELGIDKHVGSIEVGKDGDIAIWDGHPLSVYAKCVMTFVEGEAYFERRDAFDIDKIAVKKPVLDTKANFTEPTLPKESKTYAIVGATVHPVSSPTFINGTVVVSYGKILAVGKNAKVPEGATVIDGKGMHVYPGFIDGGTTMGLSEIGPVEQTVDSAELGTNQPDLDAATALFVESAHYGPARYNGVTNALSTPEGGMISGQAAVIQTDGYTTEQIGFKRKQALMVNFGGGSRNFDGIVDLCLDTTTAGSLFGVKEDEVTDQQREDYFDYLGGKILQRGGGAPAGLNDSALTAYFDKALAYKKSRESDPKFKIDLSMEAMIPYLKGEKLVIFNARSGAAIRGAVAFIKKYNLKGALSGANEAWKETTLLRASGVPVIINPAGLALLSANAPASSWDPYDSPYVIPGLLAKAGVKFCFRSGDGADVMNLPVRVGEHCAYGLSQDAAIKALTLDAAEILGVSKEIGSVEVGKVANLIVTDGDPFEQTSSYRYVFIQGQPRPLVSKHTLLRDKYNKRK